MLFCMSILNVKDAVMRMGFLSLQQPIYVSPRRDEGIAHDRMFIY